MSSPRSETQPNAARCPSNAEANYYSSLHNRAASIHYSPSKERVPGQTKDEKKKLKAQTFSPFCAPPYYAWISHCTALQQTQSITRQKKPFFNPELYAFIDPTVPLGCIDEGHTGLPTESMFLR